MVNVAHDGHHRRARFQIFRLVIDVQFNFPFLLMNNSLAFGPFFRLKPEAKMRRNLGGDFFFDGLVDGGHDPELHQLGNDGKWFLFQRLGQGPDYNGRLDGDDLRVGRQVNLWLLRNVGPIGCGTWLGPAVSTTLTAPVTTALVTSLRLGGLRTRAGPDAGRLLGPLAPVTTPVVGTQRRTHRQLNSAHQIAHLRFGRGRRNDWRGRDSGYEWFWRRRGRHRQGSRG